MRKIILCVVAIFVMLLTVNVEAATEKVSITGASLKDKSSNVTVDNTNFENNIVSSKIEFNQLDDYVIYEFTIENKDSYDYKIDSITDNNTNSYLSIDYDYNKTLKKNSTGTIQVKITYKNKSSETININDLQFKISLTGNGVKSAIDINPNTGDNIIMYVVMFILSLAGLIFFKKKAKVLFVITLLAIPFSVYAIEKKEIIVKFTNIEIRGIDQDGNPTCRANEYLQQQVIGYEITDIDACNEYFMSNYGFTNSMASDFCNGELFMESYTLSDLLFANLFSYDSVKDFTKQIKSTGVCKPNCGENEYLYVSPVQYKVTDKDACINFFSSSMDNDTATEVCNDANQIKNYLDQGYYGYSLLKSFLARQEDSWCRPEIESCFDFVINDEGNATITNYLCTETDVVIPNKLTVSNGKVDVTKIGPSAFSYKNLTSVIIPDSVIAIGEAAFRNNNLTSVEIPDNITIIEDTVFFNNQLTSFNISNGVTSLGNSAFGNNKLTSIEIPNSVTNIGFATFSNNELTSVDIPSSVTRLGDGAFHQNKIVSVELHDGLTYIGDDAFMENQITSVIIPNSVTYIGNDSFRDNKLTSLTLSKNATIGERSFMDNELTSLEIPEGVTTIKQVSFLRNKLTSVSLPSTLTTIENSAFAVNQLESLTIPNSVTSIGESAFYNNKLISVTLSDNLVTIGKNAFDSNKITSLDIPNSVTTIGEKAFDYNSLTYVKLGTGVTTIGKEAFSKSYSSNLGLTTVYNNTGKEFDWKYILRGSSDTPFETGTLSTSAGDVIITTGSPN